MWSWTVKVTSPLTLVVVFMKKYLLFTLLIVTIAALPESANAYYGYGGRGVYSQKTTAYAGSYYYPASSNYYNGYGYGGNLRVVNPFEARRVDYILSLERYQRQLVEAKNRVDAKYAMERAQRQARNAQVLAQMKATATRQGAGNKQQVAKLKPTFPQITNKNAPIVSNDDFDVLSESLEKDTDFGYKPQKQTTSMSDRPSFLQRLKWALFGRS